ncbi:MAG TPA: hypothetical protein VKU42_10365 [Candidatus Angelobacter sp.]|nr:hypothetical protein [Candidatus Angelobacter sp.]
MTDKIQGTLSGRVRQLSTDLREFDSDLKAGATPEVNLLQEFRQVLDNARMTAWTVSELLNAVETQKDPGKVLSFVAAERLRRSTQMLKDLCADIDCQGMTWQTSGIQGLYETVLMLQLQLSKVIDQHQGRLEKARGAAR